MVSQEAVEDALVAMSPSEFHCFAKLAEPTGIQGILLSGSGIDYGSTLLSEPDADDSGSLTVREFIDFFNASYRGANISDTMLYALSTKLAVLINKSESPFGYVPNDITKEQLLAYFRIWPDERSFEWNDNNHTITGKWYMGYYEEETISIISHNADADDYVAIPEWNGYYVSLNENGNIFITWDKGSGNEHYGIAYWIRETGSSTFAVQGHTAEVRQTITVEIQPGTLKANKEYYLWGYLYDADGNAGPIRGFRFNTNEFAEQEDPDSLPISEVGEFYYGHWLYYDDRPIEGKLMETGAASVLGILSKVLGRKDVQMLISNIIKQGVRTWKTTKNMNYGRNSKSSRWSAAQAAEILGLNLSLGIMTETAQVITNLDPSRSGTQITSGTQNTTSHGITESMAVGTLVPRGRKIGIL